MIPVATVERALDGLLSAVFAEEDRQREAVPAFPVFEIVTLADLRAEALPTRVESAIADMARDPVGVACQIGIRQCGEVLFGIGGFDLMQATIERVAAMDPRRSGARLDVMDKAWNGIREVWWS